MKLDTILILAGGSSTRLWPLQDKALLVFCGKPLITYQVTFYKELCDHIVVCVPQGRADEYKAVMNDERITITEQQPKWGGQMGAIWSSRDVLHGKTLITNADSVLDRGVIERMLAKAEQSPFTITLLAREQHTYFPGGYIVPEGNTVVSIIEKPGAGNEPSTIVRLSTDYYNDIQQVLGSGEPQTNTSTDDIYEQFLTKKATEKQVGYYAETFDWNYIKYPWHILDTAKTFLHSIAANRNTAHPIVHETALIEGDVYFGNNVTVHNHSKIVGPTYIGDNAIIGSYALVSESMIGKDTIIGGYTECVRSYVGERSTTHRNYIGDSVIGDNVLMGAGTTCANFRFDGNTIPSIIKGERIDTKKNKLGCIIGNGAKIGSMTTCYPGTKIGPGKKILPASIVAQDEQ